MFVQVQSGVLKFLFDLIILGELKNSSGKVWKRQQTHFYALEYTIPEKKVAFIILVKNQI